LLLESNINLQYYIKNYATNDVFWAFQLKSLKPKIYFEDEINADIKEQDGIATKWQVDLLESIHLAYKRADTSYAELKFTKISCPSIKTKFNDTKSKKLYNIAYRTKCHDVHGDWEDLAQNYLKYEKNSGLFYPRFDEYRVDIRQFNPILLVCCMTLTEFLQKSQTITYHRNMSMWWKIYLRQLNSQKTFMISSCLPQTKKHRMNLIEKRAYTKIPTRLAAKVGVCERGLCHEF